MHDCAYGHIKAIKLAPGAFKRMSGISKGMFSMRLTLTDIDIDICIVFNYISKLSCVLHTHNYCPTITLHDIFLTKPLPSIFYICNDVYVKIKKEIKNFIMRYEKKWLFLGFNREAHPKEGETL